MDRWSRRADSGSGTIWVLTTAFVILVVGLVVTMRCAAVVARHRAESAADFAALAAATRVLSGPTAACATAASIARANGATLVRCEFRGAVATVQVSAPVAGQLPGDWRARARARAGPA